MSAEMTTVVMLRSIVRPGERGGTALNIGEVHEVDSALAARWIEMGVAAAAQEA